MSEAAPLRSLLFVPGDSERKQAKALGSGADAVILDLEDSVAEAQLPAARTQVRAFLEATPRGAGLQRWVRVNSPSSGKTADDLAAVVGAWPDGIMLPKVSAAREVAEVGDALAAFEARAGIAVGSIRVIVIATETPQALLTMAGYGHGEAGPRLAGLTWGIEDLSAALGVTQKTKPDGSLIPVLELARSLCLVAAGAAGVQAIDGVYTDFRDSAGLQREAARARSEGFTAKMAIHPDQVPIINAAFSPTVAEVEHAKRVIAAFAASPGAGVTSLDGRMLDRPHLALAQRVLELSRRTGLDKA
ncbi:MAG TPA: CoA ester lyase [Steroidobacteraceae bacterium]|jgi:citrate lyase subunit beta/citryl-CoA lyase|nr:CoA ester lyase [Steroidobacteraceae bacterium]